jgi:hypothetical protein
MLYYISAQIDNLELLSPIRRHRGNWVLILLLVISIVIANSFIIFSFNEKSRFYFAKVTTTVTSSVALATALVMIYKYKRKQEQQERHDFHQFYKGDDILHFSICLFLILWFSAHLIWSLYEQQSAVPSIDDVFWLIGYGLFGYFLYKLCYSLRKKLQAHTIGIIATIVLILLTYIVLLTLSASSLLSTQKAETSILILILTYPILDGILLVPAALIFWISTITSQEKGEKTDQQTRIFWVLLSLSIILFAIADSGFAYISALNLMAIQKEVWIWNIFYNSGYLCLAASLTGYRNFLDLTKMNAAN